MATSRNCSAGNDGDGGRPLRTIAYVHGQPELAVLLSLLDAALVLLLLMFAMAPPARIQASFVGVAARRRDG